MRKRGVSESMRHPHIFSILTVGGGLCAAPEMRDTVIFRE